MWMWVILHGIQWSSAIIYIIRPSYLLIRLRTLKTIVMIKNILLIGLARLILILHKSSSTEFTMDNVSPGL